jgi:hypothetical protein
MTVCLSDLLFACLSVHPYMSVYQSVCLSVCLPASTCLPVCPTIRISVCPSVEPSESLSVSTSVCLSIHHKNVSTSSVLKEKTKVLIYFQYKLYFSNVIKKCLKFALKFSHKKYFFSLTSVRVILFPSVCLFFCPHVNLLSICLSDNHPTTDNKDTDIFSL